MEPEYLMKLISLIASIYSSQQAERNLELDIYLRWKDREMKTEKIESMCSTVSDQLNHDSFSAGER